MMEEDARRWRTVAAGILLGLGFLVALGRLFQLQVIRADELAQLAGRQYQKMLTVEGGRGAIFDRNGKILAITMDVPSVFGAPKYVSDPRATAVRLSRVLKADARQLEAKLKSERDFVWLQRHLTPERAEGLQGLALDGIGVIPEGRRFYPKGVMLSHVLGFGNIDNQGLEGLERRYDAALRGERGRLVVERDAFGGAVFPKGLNYVAPSPGKDLVLTIDEVIQYIADQELANVVARTRAVSGVVIVVEPKTGAILAMAVRPTFDPNEPKADPNLWRNRAISDAYEPGSTFKLVVAAAALEERLVSPREFIYGENGRYVVENTVVRDHHKNGWMTFAQVLQRSSNIGMVKVVEHLAPEKLAWYINAFGFGQKTDVDRHGPGDRGDPLAVGDGSVGHCERRLADAALRGVRGPILDRGDHCPLRAGRAPPPHLFANGQGPDRDHARRRPAGRHRHAWGCARVRRGRQDRDRAEDRSAHRRLFGDADGQFVRRVPAGGRSQAAHPGRGG